MSWASFFSTLKLGSFCAYMSYKVFPKTKTLTRTHGQKPSAPPLSRLFGFGLFLHRCVVRPGTLGLFPVVTMSTAAGSGTAPAMVQGLMLGFGTLRFPSQQCLTLRVGLALLGLAVDGSLHSSGVDFT